MTSRTQPSKIKAGITGFPLGDSFLIILPLSGRGQLVVLLAPAAGIAAFWWR